MSPYTPPNTLPETPTKTSGSLSIARVALVMFMTAVVALSAGPSMYGPQIMFVVPLALVAGIIFALLRSSLSLVCFGYPLLFGLVSALIGYLDGTDYEITEAIAFFAIAIGLGLVGVVMVAVGLWKALPGRKAK